MEGGIKEVEELAGEATSFKEVPGKSKGVKQSSIESATDGVLCKIGWRLAGRSEGFGDDLRVPVIWHGFFSLLSWIPVLSSPYDATPGAVFPVQCTPLLFKRRLLWNSQSPAFPKFPEGPRPLRARLPSISFVG